MIKCLWAFPGGPVVRAPPRDGFDLWSPAMQETPVRFLGQEEGLGYPLQYSWTFLVAQLVNNVPAMRETWVGKIPWKRERLPSPVFWLGEFHGQYSPRGPKELGTTE